MSTPLAVALIVLLAVFNVESNDFANFQTVGRKSNRVNLLSQAVGTRMLQATKPQTSQIDTVSSNGMFVPIQRSVSTMMDMTNQPLTNKMTQQQPQQQMFNSNGFVFNSPVVAVTTTTTTPAPMIQQRFVQQPMMNQVNQPMMNQFSQQTNNMVRSTNFTQQQQPMMMPVQTPQVDLCKGAQPGDIIPHPANINQFVICYGFGEFTVMDCPEHLVYNPHLVRCDLETIMPLGCQSNPCMNNGKCTDLPAIFSYKCECPVGFTGVNCETTDNCANKPCGPDGVCISMPTGSPVSSVCMCSAGRAIGQTCQNVEMNPCFTQNANFKQFVTKINPGVFVQCEGIRPHFKFCQFPLVFSAVRQACDWVAN